MADFDLRELSAPIEKLRSDVNAAYKRLDAKWDAVTQALTKLPIPCDVGYTFDEDDFCSYPPDCLRIEWRKWKGKKRICIVHCYRQDTPEGPGEAETVTPYDEWGGEQRINMLKQVPKLFEAATEQTKAFIAKAQGQEERT